MEVLRNDMDEVEDHVLTLSPGDWALVSAEEHVDLRETLRKYLD